MPPPVGSAQQMPPPVQPFVQPQTTFSLGAFTGGRGGQGRGGGGRGGGGGRANNRPVDENGVPLVWNYPEIYPRFSLGELPPRSHDAGWNGFCCVIHLAFGLTHKLHPRTADAKPAPGECWYHNPWYCPKVPAFLDLQVEHGKISAEEGERLKKKIPAPYWESSPPTQA